MTVERWNEPASARLCVPPFYRSTDPPSQAARAYAKLTARRAQRFNARCTARAYAMKLSPAHGYRAKNSVGNMSPFWRLHRAHANTTLPGACAPPCDSGYTWSRVAKSNSSGAAQYTHRRPQSRIAARLIAPFCCAEEICLARRWTRGTRGRETRWNCRRRDNVTSLKRQHPAPGTCPVAGCRADHQRTGYSGDRALVALSWSLSDPRRSTFFSMSGKTAHWPPVGRGFRSRAIQMQ